MDAGTILSRDSEGAARGAMATKQAVTEPMKDRIWEEMADVGRYVQYYEAVANSCLTRDRWMRIAIFVGSGVGIGALTGAIPEPVDLWFGLGAALTLLAATAASFVFDWGVRGAYANAIHGECHLVSVEYIDLWTRIRAGKIEDDEADRKSKELVTRLAVVTMQLSGSDRGQNKRAQKRAYRILENRWSKN